MTAAPENIDLSKIDFILRLTVVSGYNAPAKIITATIANFHEL